MVKKGDRLITYLLVGCDFSRKAEKFIQMYQIPYEKILVPNDETKEKYKEQNDMETFPQIFYHHEGKKDLIKIGGYNELILFYDLYNELKAIPIEMHLNIINNVNIIKRKKDLFRVMTFIFKYLKNKP